MRAVNAQEKCELHVTRKLDLEKKSDLLTAAVSSSKIFGKILISSGANSMHHFIFQVNRNI